MSDPEMGNRAPRTTLCSLNEKLQHHDAYFETREREMPGLGSFKLVGSREMAYGPDEKGIALTEVGPLLLGAQELYEIGYYELMIQGANIDSKKIIRSSTKLSLAPENPALKTTLTTVIELSDDKLATEQFGTSDTWKSSEDRQDYLLFGPADPAILGRLELAFQSTNPEPS